MKILLTNDDGYDAEGIKVLYDILKTEHEVYVVAPLKNQSGASSRISMTVDHQLLPVSDEYKADNCYALDGTPVDCVVSGLKGGYLASVPDLVISGINRGGNIGTDVVYSGTCGAARQASLYGIPGVALSTEIIAGVSEKDYIYEGLAEFALKNLEVFIRLCGEKTGKEADSGYGYFLNINAPSSRTFDGVEFTRMSRRLYGDGIKIVKGEDDSLYSRFVGGNDIQTPGEADCDFQAMKRNHISVSVMNAEPVCRTDNIGPDTQLFRL